MSQGSLADLVHGPLAQWADSRGDSVAISDGRQHLSFAQLNEAVSQRAQEFACNQAPATVLIHDGLPLTQRLVEFLAVISSGRCAAVGDPDWPPTVRQAVQASLSAQAAVLPAPGPDAAFYVGYTSGSTGTPKGYRRHHRSWTESFRVCMAEFGAHAGSRILAPGRDSHSLFLFGMLLGLWSGAGVVVQEQFSAAAALETLRHGDTPSLVAVPSQLIMMLELARHRALAPMDEVRLIMVSGARWIRSRTGELRALFPRARIIEFYGASETSFIAWMDSDETTPAQVVGRPFQNVELQIRAAEGEDGAGLIYVRSPMLFMDYVGGADDGTAALREGDWLSVRDLGYLDPQGRLCLVGRQNRMIVTRGKNLFPEELESVLEAHPAVASASVHGVEDAVRGMQVVALLRLKPQAGVDSLSAMALVAWCRQRLEAYKAPRQCFVCHDWRLTPSGKTDHRALAHMLRRHLEGGPAADAPCLTPLA